MNGLDLAERFYEECGRPLIGERFPDYAGRIAAGLVGEGSECFGFDDDLSHDHDWGPGFCLWLTAGDHAEIGAGLQALYEGLPASFGGFSRPTMGPRAGKRAGVFEVTEFYRRFARYDHVPATLAEWRALPETFLATATNGRVFTDPLGEFTAFREGLLAFYPEDLRRKKIAARCAAAGQAGQYNYGRSIERGEWVAAHCSLSAFVEAVISLVYLLNKRYRPFYKWMHRGMQGLPVLGGECYRLLGDLCAEPEAGTGESGARGAGRQRLVEEISSLVVGRLVMEGLSATFFSTTPTRSRRRSRTRLCGACR